MKKELTLKLGGKNRKFTFGLIFIGEVLERLDIDYNELLQKVVKNPFKYAPILMFESLKNSYTIKDKALDFTEKDIIIWLEKQELLGVDCMTEFVRFFLGVNENPTPVKSVENGENVKKK